MYDYVRSESVPFMGFTKERDSNGRVRWARVNKPPLTKQALDIIVNATSEHAKLMPTEEKRVWLYAKFETIRHEGTKDKTTLVIGRQDLFHDSFEQFRTTTGLDLRGEIKIHFVDEMAQDAGGLIREWFSGIVEEIFRPAFGLFQRANVPELSFVINEGSAMAQKNHLQYFRFAGQVIAKALFERTPVKAYLNWTLLKQMLGQQITEADLKYYDKELWKSISFLQETRIEKEQALATFTAMQKDPVAAKDVIIELKPMGKDIVVFDENKGEFIQLFIDYHLRKKVQPQLESFLDGFYSLVPRDCVSSLDPDELEFFLCGISSLDLADWRQNTTYKSYYNPEHDVIKWFWKVMENVGEEYRQKFLQFATGSSRVPAEGFKGLMSNSGRVCAFCIEPKEYTGPDTSFVVAHTCFNRIELPNYPSLELMELSIRKVLDSPNCASFAFE